MTNDDESEFVRLLPGVKRLRQDRINVYQHRPLKFKAKRAQKLSPEPRLSSAPARTTQFNAGLQKKVQRRIRQGSLRPEASLDLHGCRQDQALDLLQAFVEDALRENRRMLLIIHGQGFRSQQDAVLKPLVQRWLATQASVLAWCPAQSRDGAAGATYVYLRGS